MQSFVAQFVPRSWSNLVSQLDSEDAEPGGYQSQRWQYNIWVGANGKTVLKVQLLQSFVTKLDQRNPLGKTQILFLRKLFLGFCIELEQKMHRICTEHRSQYP